MELLRSDRRRSDGTGWPPRRFLSHPLAWPFAQRGEALAQEHSWPAVQRYNALLGVPSEFVTFAPSSPELRRLGYDAAIHRTRRVATRERHWHDLFNALVWAAFPLAKWALHEAQLGYLRVAPEGRRCAEHDLLAMLDEGGVLGWSGDAEPSALFGHALLEHLELRAARVRARTVWLPARDKEAGLEALDRSLAALLRERRHTAESRPYWVEPT